VDDSPSNSVSRLQANCSLLAPGRSKNGTEYFFTATTAADIAPSRRGKGTCIVRRQSIGLCGEARPPASWIREMRRPLRTGGKAVIGTFCCSEQWSPSWVHAAYSVHLPLALFDYTPCLWLYHFLLFWTIKPSRNEWTPLEPFDWGFVKLISVCLVYVEWTFPEMAVVSTAWFPILVLIDLIEHMHAV
jgi:hypothetical protein